jgi:hypothetical protein
MADRYPVSFGYPDKLTPTILKRTPRLRGNLSKERYAKWCERMSTLASVDEQMHKEAVSACTETLPPTGKMLLLFDVMAKQQYDHGDYAALTASLSYSSITAMAEYLKHWHAVEDELEAEQRSVSNEREE